jgi:hypothetical protein
VIVFSGLLRAGVLGDGLGAFADRVFCQFSRQQQADRSLNFAGSDGRPLVVVGQARGFGGNSFENVVDEAVHDGHGFAADASVRMHLLQHFVDVGAVGLLPLPLALFVARATGSFFACFFRSFRRVLRWHVQLRCVFNNVAAADTALFI